MMIPLCFSEWFHSFDYQLRKHIVGPGSILRRCVLRQWQFRQVTRTIPSPYSPLALRVSDGVRPLLLEDRDLQRPCR